MKEMAQVLHSLREELKSHTDSLLDYKESCIESHGEWVSQGWCEALAFAIGLIEKTDNDSKTAVTTLKNYLLTGERGTNGTEESN